MVDYDSKYYKRAKRRVKEKKAFYKHLGSYLAVNTGLFILNVATSDFMWVLFPILIWGFSVASHYVKVFGLPVFGTLGRDWEEEKIQEEIERLEQEEEMRRWMASRKRFDDDDLELEDPDDWKLKDYDELRREDEF